MLSIFQKISSRNLNLAISIVKRAMASSSTPDAERKNWEDLVYRSIHRLSDDKHKGQAGRIGVIGGSLEYTGGPYFAAISALKVGADLVHVFCSEAASPVIKSYSPELIVHPLIDREDALKEVAQWLERIHVLVIGPGLGRDPNILQNVTEIIHHCRQKNKPLIIDADGLFLITQNIDLIKNYPYPGIILTPNKIEFERLYKVIKKPGATDANIDIDFDKLGENILILRKGSVDETFSVDAANHWTNGVGGSARRCGGQGDLLCGSMATFFNWSLNNLPNDNMKMMPAAVASFAASQLTRACNEKAFSQKGRSMVCSDMIEKIHEAFTLFGIIDSIPKDGWYNIPEPKVIHKS